MNDEKKTILIVDDTIENVDILRDILSNTYTLKVALTGEKALDIVQKTPKIDLILLDIMMPEMDGYEVIERLKSDPNNENIPVIFITALTDSEDETKGFMLGAADYITKPIKPSVVLARVATQIKLCETSLELQEKNQKLEKLVRVLENKLGRVQSCSKTVKNETTTGDGATKSEHEKVSLDEYFLEDDKSDLEEIHENIDSVIHMILLQNRIDINMLQRLGTLFYQYGSKLLVYPVFYRLGNGMSDFSRVLMEEQLDPSPENIQFSIECMESLIYTLEYWYVQVFRTHISDVNIYDNSMLADMQTIQLALRNEMDSVESDIEFF